MSSHGFGHILKDKIKMFFVKFAVHLKNGSSQLGWHLNPAHKINRSTNQNSATNISNQIDLNAETEDEEEVPYQINSKKND